MNRHILPALILATALLAACSTPPVKTADKNFERAWLAYTTLRTDQAVGYFADAADDYAKALEADQPSRVAQYPSSRVKAGMANYFAGRFEECIASMAAARRTGERIWEADLFTALAHARLGDRDKAIGNLALFLEGLPPVRMVFEIAQVQLAGLQYGADLDRTADILEESVQKQIVEDIRLTLSPNTIMPVTERCNGTFWWRRNKKPCSASRDTGQ
jgi:tetratricopeptide (TPR) repeat protein